MKFPFARVDVPPPDEAISSTESLVPLRQQLEQIELQTEALLGSKQSDRLRREDSSAPSASSRPTTLCDGLLRPLGPPRAAVRPRAGDSRDADDAEVRRRCCDATWAHLHREHLRLLRQRLTCSGIASSDRVDAAERDNAADRLGAVDGELAQLRARLGLAPAERREGGRGAARRGAAPVEDAPKPPPPHWTPAAEEVEMMLRERTERWRQQMPLRRYLAVLRDAAHATRLPLLHGAARASRRVAAAAERPAAAGGAAAAARGGTRRSSHGGGELAAAYPLPAPVMDEEGALRQLDGLARQMGLRLHFSSVAQLLKAGTTAVDAVCSEAIATFEKLHAQQSAYESFDIEPALRQHAGKAAEALDAVQRAERAAASKDAVRAAEAAVLAAHGRLAAFEKRTRTCDLRIGEEVEVHPEDGSAPLSGIVVKLPLEKDDKANAYHSVTLEDGRLRMIRRSHVTALRDAERTALTNELRACEEALQKARDELMWDSTGGGERKPRRPGSAASTIHPAAAATDAAAAAERQVLRSSEWVRQLPHDCSTDLEGVLQLAWLKQQAAPDAALEVYSELLREPSTRVAVARLGTLLATWSRARHTAASGGERRKLQQAARWSAAGGGGGARPAGPELLRAVQLLRVLQMRALRLQLLQHLNWMRGVERMLGAQERLLQAHFAEGEVAAAEPEPELLDGLDIMGSSRRGSTPAPPLDAAPRELGEEPLVPPLPTARVRTCGGERALHEIALADMEELEHELVVRGSALLRLHQTYTQKAALEASRVASSQPPPSPPGRRESDPAADGRQGECAVGATCNSPRAVDEGKGAAGGAAHPAANVDGGEEPLEKSLAARVAAATAAAAAAVDVPALLLTVLSREAEFQAAKSELILEYLQLLPHCALPSELAALQRRVRELRVMRSTCAPPCARTPRTVASGARRDAEPGFADGVSAVHAMHNLDDTYAWQLGEGSRLKMESLRLEAQLLRQLRLLGGRVSRTGPLAEREQGSDSEDAASAGSGGACCSSVEGESAVSRGGDSRDVGSLGMYEVEVDPCGKPSDAVTLLLDLAPAVEEVVSSLLAVPQLSSRTPEPVVHIVMLRHALFLYAGMEAGCTFRRAPTDMLIDPDACIEAVHEVVSLLPSASSSSGLPSPNKRCVSARPAQAAPKPSVEASNLLVLSRAHALLELLLALDEELEHTRVVTMRQTFLERFRMEEQKSQKSPKERHRSRNHSGYEYESQTSSGGCREKALASMDMKSSSGTYAALHRTRQASKDDAPASSKGWKGSDKEIKCRTGIDEMDARSCSGASLNSRPILEHAQSGTRRVIKVMEGVAMGARLGSRLNQKAPSISGGSRISCAEGVSTAIGGRVSGLSRSSVFSFSPPPIELSDAFKDGDFNTTLALCFSRPVAIAESDEGLCDYSPDQKTWWCDALLVEANSASELRTACRLQGVLRESISIVTAHNLCAITVTLSSIQDAHVASHDNHTSPHEPDSALPLVCQLCVPPQRDDEEGQVVASHGILRPVVAEQLKRVLPRVWLHANAFDKLQREDLKRKFKEISYSYNRGLQNAADISRVAVQARSSKLELLDKYCSELVPTMRAPAARTAAAELSASLVATVRARYDNLFHICRDPLETPEGQGQGGPESEVPQRRSGNGHANEQVNEIASMLDHRGDLVSLSHIPDPRYALRELRASADVPADVATEALETQAFALAQLSQLISLLELSSVLESPDRLPTRRCYPEPVQLPIALDSVHPQVSDFVHVELRRILQTACQLLPCSGAHEKHTLDLAHDEGFPEPVRLLSFHVEQLLLQIQVSLYGAGRALSLQPSTAKAVSTVEGKANDAAYLLQAQQHLHLLLHGRRMLILPMVVNLPISKATGRSLEPAHNDKLQTASWLRNANTSHDVGTPDGLVLELSMESNEEASRLAREQNGASRSGCRQLQRATTLVATDLRLLSEAAMLALRSEHAVTVDLIARASIEGNGAQAPTSTNWDAEVQLLFLSDQEADGSITDVPDGACLAGLGELRKWVFDEAWDSDTLPPPLLQVEHRASEGNAPSEAPISPHVKEVDDENKLAEVEEVDDTVDERRQTSIDKASARVDMLNTQLELLRRRAQLERMFRHRCPHFSISEFDGVYEWLVRAQAGTSYQEALHPLEVAHEQLRLTESWCTREELLHETAEKMKRLERLAGREVLAAEKQLESQGKMVLTEETAKLRHLFATAAEEEHLRVAADENLQANKDIGMQAVEQLLEGKARPPCVALVSSVENSESALLCSRLFRARAPANTCVACDDAADVDSAACAYDAWTPQLRSQIFIALDKWNTQRSSNGVATWGEGLDREEEPHEFEGDDLILSAAENELLQLLQVAYEGRHTSAQPEIGLMRTAVLKTMVTVSLQGTQEDAVLSRKRNIAPILRQFDDCLASPESFKTFDKLICVESFKRLRLSASTSELTSRCCTRRHRLDENSLWASRQRSLGLLSRAYDEANKLSWSEPLISSELAVGALELKVKLLYQLDSLERQLSDATAQEALAEMRVTARVRQECEAEADYASVKQLLLRGRCAEERFKVKGVVQQCLLDTKREAMQQMVQSGALPIGIKQEALAALREEEALKEVNDEALQMRLLLGRIKTTSTLQLLKRKRIHYQLSQAAEQRRLDEQPILDEMGSSRRRNELLKRKLLETQRSLSKCLDEQESLEKRQAQLYRSMAKLRAAERSGDDEPVMGGRPNARATYGNAMERLLERSNEALARASLLPVHPAKGALTARPAILSAISQKSTAPYAQSSARNSTSPRFVATHSPTLTSSERTGAQSARKAIVRTPRAGISSGDISSPRDGNDATPPTAISNADAASSHAREPLCRPMTAKVRTGSVHPAPIGAFNKERISSSNLLIHPLGIVRKPFTASGTARKLD